MEWLIGIACVCIIATYFGISSDALVITAVVIVMIGAAVYGCFWIWAMMEDMSNQTITFIGMGIFTAFIVGLKLWVESNEEKEQQAQN